MAVIFFFTVSGAMVVDAGFGFLARRDYQGLVDIVALSAVASLPDQAQAKAAAHRYLAANGFDETDPDLTATIEFPQANRIRVSVTGAQDQIFSDLFGFGTRTAAATAVAELEQVPVPYALMAMNTSACATLLVRGQPTATVTGGGGTYTRSTCSPDALRSEGQARLDTSLNHVAGGATSTGESSISPAPEEGYDDIGDPFDHLVQPTPSGLCYAGSYNITAGVHVLSPGRYCEQLRVSSTAEVTLQSGIYFFHQGLNVDGTGSFTSGDDEVMLMATCPASPCNGAVPADVRFAGTVDSTMSGRSEYDNIVIWMDRTAGPGAQVLLRGESVSGIDGNIYAVASEVSIEGQSGSTLTLNATVVADEIELAGQGNIEIAYDATKAPTYELPVLVE